MDLFQIKPQTWESTFFDKSICDIAFDKQTLCTKDINILKEQLFFTLKEAENTCDLLRLSFSARNSCLFSIAQQLGFEVVEIRMVHRTYIDSSDYQDTEKHFDGTIRIANISDQAAILELLQEEFIENVNFHSRFKNSAYFTYEQGMNYYGHWIKQALSSEKSSVIVYEYKNNIIGFMSFLESPEEEGSPVYRVGLTGISKKFTGKGIYKQLDSYLYSIIPVPNFYLYNTTHIDNIAMLRNYSKRRKSLYQTEYILYYQYDNSVDESL